LGRIAVTGERDESPHGEMSSFHAQVGQEDEGTFKHFDEDEISVDPGIILVDL
jgi:hypothetical protein